MPLKPFLGAHRTFYFSPATTLSKAGILASTNGPRRLQLERTHLLLQGACLAALTSSSSRVAWGGLPERVPAARGEPQDVALVTVLALVLATS